MAARQHGVVSRRQLLEMGVGRRMVAGRLRRGTLLTLHPGVYRVGHAAPDPVATYAAAVIACGQGSLLAGPAAAYLLGIVKARSAPIPEVIAPTERRLVGVRTHRARAGIHAADREVVRGIPVTSSGRTIVDLAGVLSMERLARAFHEASVLYGLEPEVVEAVLRRRPATRGASRLRRVLRGDERVTLSVLERRFLALLRGAGLPLPETNTKAGTRLVDCRWPRERLTVELDGYRFHSTRHAWEQDRRREREAFARGDDFRRFTYGDVVERPTDLLRELNAILVRRPG